MATPADQRLLDLLDKWLMSLELHATYCSLDDDSYAKVQAWPKHQRPSRWIIDLARQKAVALRAQVEERIGQRDMKFAESLELMTFLANLVGSEHIERFIPLAEPARDSPTVAPAEAVVDLEANAATGTREMPTFSAGNAPEPAPVGSATVARVERKNVATNGKHAPALRPSASSTYNRDGPSEEVREQVIADATRLVQWGRKWYELAELIASMADRPHVTDVRRILKDNKAVIDERAGRT